VDEIAGTTPRDGLSDANGLTARVYALFVNGQRMVEDEIQKMVSMTVVFR
jgi:hypothetical protein